MKVEEARGGAEALRKLRSAAADSEPYDLALLDLQMPDMDGLDLARLIKEDQSISRTSLVLVTSRGQRGDGEEARRMSIEAYLTKPVRQAQLYDTLSIVMGAPETEDDGEEESTMVTAHSLKEVQAQSRLRVLLAEDNEVNQKVAVRTLEKLGYRTDVADDGEEAVEAVSRTDYAAIVMDVQMPKMDGYEATAEIRRREREHGGHIPIIAMTANALQGDREKALEAGMDDYVAKPVRAEEFGEVLRRWVSFEEEEATAEEEEVATTGENGGGEGALDPAVLESLEDLQQDGEPDIVAELASMFLEDADSRLDTLRKAVEEDDADTVQSAAHALKGSSGNIGARGMQKVCAELEETAESGDLDPAPEFLEQLEAEFDSARTELASLKAEE
jgi:CheY-like chemotaxis protein